MTFSSFFVLNFAEFRHERKIEGQERERKQECSTKRNPAPKIEVMV